MAIDTVARVDTPERTQFAYRLAGPCQRAAAYLIDLGVKGGVLLGVGTVVFTLGAGGETLAGIGQGLLLLGLFVLDWGYYVVCELGMAGQSPGKRAVNLRVVRSDGLAITFRESALRNLLRAADFLPTWYFLGGLCMALDPKFRRLGDIAAGTFVIVEKSEGALPPLQIEPPATAFELGELPGQLRLAGAELEAIEMLLRRSKELPRQRTKELADLVAPVLAARMNLTYRDSVRFLALIYRRVTGAGAP